MILLQVEAVISWLRGMPVAQDPDAVAAVVNYTRMLISCQRSSYALSIQASVHSHDLKQQQTWTSTFVSLSSGFIQRNTYLYPTDKWLHSLN